MTVCTFAGHREVYQANIADRLDEAIAQIIETDDSFRFLVGGMGDFDGMCSSAVRRAKRKYPDKQISLELVLPYLTQELNENKQFYETSYDDVIDISAIAEHLMLMILSTVWLQESEDFAFSANIYDYLDNKWIPQAVQALNKQWGISKVSIVGEA